MTRILVNNLLKTNLFYKIVEEGRILSEPKFVRILLFKLNADEKIPNSHFLLFFQIQAHARRFGGHGAIK